MTRNHIGVLVLTCLVGPVSHTATAAANPGAQPAEPADQIVVRERALEQLRVRVRLAENDVYARFNDINSSDLYDFHCYERASTGTRIKKRVCLSNAWRAADAAMAQATVWSLQGGDGVGGASIAGAYGPHAEQYRANQLATERRVIAEMGRLAHEDPALGAAMVRLGQAYQAEELVSGTHPQWTLYREVTTGEKGLPFDAQHLFEVHIGQVAWTHPLASRTFTLGSVSGHIRDLRIACDHASAKLGYRQDVEWTIPAAWGACTLEVHAKRETTFALYEFQ